MSYFEINLILDFAFLVALSFLLLPRSPSLYIFLLILNISQYFIPLPEPSEIMAQQQQFAAPAKRSSQPFATALTPRQQMQMTADIFDTVIHGMGGGGSVKEQIEQQLKSVTGTARSKFSFSIPKVMEDAFRDPQALWLLARLCWFAAALAVFIQRADVGVYAFAGNLLPVPFFSMAIPALANWYREKNSQYDLDTLASDPGRMGKLASLFWEHAGGIIFLLLLVAIPVFLLLTMRKSAKRRKFIHSFESFLDPAAYRIELNGRAWDFTVEGDEIVIGDFRLKPKSVAFDESDKARWILDTNTIIRFVEK